MSHVQPGIARAVPSVMHAGPGCARVTRSGDAPASVRTSARPHENRELRDIQFPGKGRGASARHREYIAQLAAEGRLVAGGPFTDGSGGLFIYTADSLAAAEEIVAADPYQVGGAFASYRLSPWEVVRVNTALISAADQGKDKIKE
jgi:uncharacterized protein